MKVTCPKNPDHKRFEVAAHVAQLWLVNENGEFVEQINDCDQVTHYPASGDMFVCHDCTEGESIGKVER
jgi:hypothetical protein